MVRKNEKGKTTINTSRSKKLISEIGFAKILEDKDDFSIGRETLTANISHTLSTSRNTLNPVTID